MIEGVILTPLKQILDERGKVMHMLRADALHFRGFGEIYFSTVNPGAIKGWRLHRQMVLNCAVPFGNVKFVLFDNRSNSQTCGEIQEIFIGSDNYCLITVPPMVWHGYKGIGIESSIVANCASIPHDPEEIERKDPFDTSIPYNWEIKCR